MTTETAPPSLAVMTVEQVIQNLMADAFPPGRRAYSMIYRHGVESILEDRLHRTRKLPELDLRPGGVAFDAYMAGRQEGKEIARRAGLSKTLAQGVSPVRVPKQVMLDLLTRIASEVGLVSFTAPISADSHLPAPLVDYLRTVIEHAGCTILEPIDFLPAANDQASDADGEFRFELSQTGFAPGDEVTIIGTGTAARVIDCVHTPANGDRYLVDYKHGPGYMRQTYHESELAARLAVQP